MSDTSRPASTDSHNRPLAVIIMAAGQGKRMQDPTKPKVLYPLADKPLVGHVLGLCSQIMSERTVVIVGYGRDRVIEYLRETHPDVQTALQEQQLGTGHAVQQAERALDDFDGDVLVLSGDVPLLSCSTAQRLIDTHRECGALATVLAVKLANPTGYGRIVRTESGSLEKIVEEKDADEATKAIHEINSGIYVFDAKVLFSVLKRVDRNNAQGEFYLTDVFALLIEQFGRGSVGVVTTEDELEVTGVNTKDQLAQLEAAYLGRMGKGSVPSQTSAATASAS